MTTAKDVAQRLNVSVSTVGRALADDPRISAETKFRVRQAAEEIGYVANRAARIMRGARSPVIGLVVPDVRNSFYSTVAHALSETLSAQQHQVMLCETGDDRQVELRQVRDLVAAQVSGIVIVPTWKPLPDAVRLLRQVPHVQLLRRLSSLSPHWFGIDDRAVINTSAGHVADLGHERIAYLGGTRELPTAEARFAGFQEALTARGLQVDPQLTLFGPPTSDSFGATGLAQLLELPEPPTAVVTGSVQATNGMLQRAHRIGLRVPGDLSLVGFGDEPGFSWWGPGLTTVSFPMHDLASSCGAWLLNHLMAGPQGELGRGTSYSSVSAGTLVIRGSTSRPGSAT